MEELNLEALKGEWVGIEFDTAEFEVKEAAMVDWAKAVGETEGRFTDPDHSDFQAHPTFTTQFVSRRVLPKGFPRLGRGGFDGGKCVTSLVPVRAGDRLTGKSMIADLYEKTGRSGKMIFLVHRMNFHNQAGERVSTVDWKLVQQTREQKGSG